MSLMGKRLTPTGHGVGPHQDLPKPKRRHAYLQSIDLNGTNWLVASDFDEPSSNTKLKRVSVCLVSDTRKYTGWAEVSDAANPREVLSLAEMKDSDALSLDESPAPQLRLSKGGRHVVTIPLALELGRPSAAPATGVSSFAAASAAGVADAVDARLAEDVVGWACHTAEASSLYQRYAKAECGRMSAELAREFSAAAGAAAEDQFVGEDVYGAAAHLFRAKQAALDDALGAAARLETEKEQLTADVHAAVLRVASLDPAVPVTRAEIDAELLALAGADAPPAPKPAKAARGGRGAAGRRGGSAGKP